MKIIHEDEALLVIDKPAKVTVEDLALSLSKKFYFLEDLPRFGLVHRLDKETSGVLLIAKNIDSLSSLQKAFKEQQVKKRYLCLVHGKTEQEGEIKSLIGRAPSDRKKQKVYFFNEPKAENKREAITRYKKRKDFQDYSLLEVWPQTGRKHQIRCHLAYLNHPIVGDKVYGFKNQSALKDIERHFLHAEYLKIKDKEFFSELPKELKEILNNLK